MKKIIVTLVAVLCLVPGVAILPPAVSAADTPRVWRLLQTSPYTHAVSIAAFLDKATGFTVGSGGASHFSTDSGATWIEGLCNSMCRWGLEVIDRNTAISVGNGGGVRITRDAGRTWAPLADFGGEEPGHGKFVSFSSPSNGWCATSWELGATTDGGQSWHGLNLPPEIKTIQAIYQLSNQEGFVLNPKGILAHTKDNGASWTLGTIKLDGTKLSPVQNYAPLAALHFDTSTTGFALLYCSNPGPSWRMFSTTDGGATWTQDVLPGKIGVPWLNRDASLLTINELSTRQISLYARSTVAQDQ